MTKKECEKALENLRILERKDNFKKWGGQVSPQINCDVVEQLIKDHFELVEKIKTGELSDGYHTFNELYYHRAVLFSVICNSHKDIAWKSKNTMTELCIMVCLLLVLIHHKDNIVIIMI